MHPVSTTSMVTHTTPHVLFFLGGGGISLFLPYHMASFKKFWTREYFVREVLNW